MKIEMLPATCGDRAISNAGLASADFGPTDFDSELVYAVLWVFADTEDRIWQWGDVLAQLGLRSIKTDSTELITMFDGGTEMVNTLKGEPVLIGGLRTCCLETLNQRTETATDKEVAACTKCDQRLVYRQDGWQWLREGHQP